MKSFTCIACLVTHLTATRKSRLGRVHLNGVLVVPCLAVGLHTTHHTLKHSALHITPDNSPNIQTHTLYMLVHCSCSPCLPHKAGGTLLNCGLHCAYHPKSRVDCSLRGPFVSSLAMPDNTHNYRHSKTPGSPRSQGHTLEFTQMVADNTPTSKNPNIARPQSQQQ